jgi:hypothetical protein
MEPLHSIIELPGLTNQTSETLIVTHSSRKGNIPIKHRFVQELIENKKTYTGHVPLGIESATVTNNNLIELVLTTHCTTEMEQVSLTKFRRGWLLRLGDFLFSNDVNYSQYKFSFQSSSIQLSNKTKAIRLTLYDASLWPEFIFTASEGSHFLLPNSTNKTISRASASLNIHDLDKSIEQLMVRFTDWKAQQRQQTDGYVFEVEFAKFCRELNTDLYRLALPASLPYKQAPSTIFFDLLSNNK